MRTAFCGMLCFTSLIACGTDDTALDQEQGNWDETPNNQLIAEEARKFVGYWYNSQSGNQAWASNFVFNADGTCIQKASNGTNSGYWNYNASTGILATTTGSWQWTVTIATENQWGGVSLGSNRTMTYTKLHNKSYIEFLLLHSSWKTEDGTIVSFKDVEWPTGGHYLRAVVGTSDLPYSNLPYFLIDDIDDNFNGKIKVPGNDLINKDIKVVDVYSITGLKLVFGYGNIILSRYHT